MKRIYKYKVLIVDYIYISLPKNAQVIKFGKQGFDYYIWAIVDPEASLETREFRVIGTGHPLEEMFLIEYAYVDTWIETDGLFVWHLFETIRH